MITFRVFFLNNKIFSRHYAFLSHSKINDILYHNNSHKNNFRRQLSSDTSDKQGDDIVIEKVYDGLLTQKVRMVKMFSLSTSAIGIMAQPTLYSSASFGTSTLYNIFYAFFGFYTFVTPLLIHGITRKYVTAIYYNRLTDQYTVNILSLFMRTKEITFSADDVFVPEVPAMFTSFIVNDKPFLIDMSSFIDTSHYVRLMGFQKPIDFKLAKKTPIKVHDLKKE